MGNSRRVWWCLLAGAMIASAWGFSEPARAEVSVSINLGPPPIIVSQPPEVVMIPQSQVHFVPDPNIDVFFYGGFWWLPRREGWYRARHVPYGQWKKDRVRWDKENRKAHKQWEREREMEWKRGEQEHRKDDMHGDRGRGYGKQGR